MTTTSIRNWFDNALESRLEEPARAWFTSARAEIAAGVTHERFCALLATASRHVRREGLRPTAAELGAASELSEGWNPERWSRLESLRVALVLARPDLTEESCVEALEEAFKYADEGEACALYRSLSVMPEAERFAWRGGEGCRTNMLTVFESIACDSSFPSRAFDEVAWKQLCMKSIFVGSPLHRVYGLDARLSPDLARMALDLVEERRSAGREIQPELWLCLGNHAGERGLESMKRELDPANAHRAGRCAAALALARAGGADVLRGCLAGEADEEVARTMRGALERIPEPAAFASLVTAQ